jgi:hypothetical protein
LKTVVAGRRFLAVLVSAVAVAAACGGTSTGQDTDGPDCVVLCEKGKAQRCPGAAGLNCDDNCFSEDATAETSGCRNTYNSTLACFDEVEDICTVRSNCAAELVAHQTCVKNYCSKNPADFCPP